MKKGKRDRVCLIKTLRRWIEDLVEFEQSILRRKNVSETNDFLFHNSLAFTLSSSFSHKLKVFCFYCSDVIETIMHFMGGRSSSHTKHTERVFSSIFMTQSFQYLHTPILRVEVREKKLKMCWTSKARFARIDWVCGKRLHKRLMNQKLSRERTHIMRREEGRERDDMRKCYSINKTCANSSDSHVLEADVVQVQKWLFAFVLHSSTRNSRTKSTLFEVFRKLITFLIYHISYFKLQNNINKKTRQNLQFQLFHSTRFPCFSQLTIAFILADLLRSCHSTLKISETLSPSSSLPSSNKIVHTIFILIIDKYAKSNKKKKSNFRKPYSSRDFPQPRHKSHVIPETFSLHPSEPTSLSLSLLTYENICKNIFKIRAVWRSP